MKQLLVNKQDLNLKKKQSLLQLSKKNTEHDLEQT